MSFRAGTGRLATAVIFGEGTGWLESAVVGCVPAVISSVGLAPVGEGTGRLELPVTDSVGLALFGEGTGRRETAVVFREGFG